MAARNHKKKNQEKCEFNEYLITISDVGCPVVIAVAIHDAMLLPTDECFTQKVPEPVYDGLTCPKYALWDSNPGSLLAKEHKSRLRFGGRLLLLLNDEAWRCHPYTQAL